MSQKATGTFEVTKWDENTYNNLQGASKQTRATVHQTYSGDIKGESAIEYLMFFRDEESANFIGMEHFVGEILGKPGSCVFRHNGTFENGVAKSEWIIIKGSGTGSLANLTGKGSFKTLHHAKAEYQFEIK